MRPRKRILLIDADEYRASVRSFMLSTNVYRVIPAASAEAALALFGEIIPDVILAANGFQGLGKLLAELHDRDAYIPQIVIADANQECNAICDLFLLNPTPAELLDRLRIVAARKRGPRTATPDVSMLRQRLSEQRIA